ncbi:MAG: reverse transcriptase domain-containing protein, partial [Acidimicrobiales bacterium]
ERAVLRRWLKAGFMDRSMLHPTDEGTPQGGIISPVLANLALDGLHGLLRQHFPQHRHRMVNLVRYADDFIITGATPRCSTTRSDHSWNGSSLHEGFGCRPRRRSSRMWTWASTFSARTYVSTAASC